MNVSYDTRDDQSLILNLCKIDHQTDMLSFILFIFLKICLGVEGKLLNSWNHSVFAGPHHVHHSVWFRKTVLDNWRISWSVCDYILEGCYEIYKGNNGKSGPRVRSHYLNDALEGYRKIRSDVRSENILDVTQLLRW